MGTALEEDEVARAGTETACIWSVDLTEEGLFLVSFNPDLEELQYHYRKDCRNTKFSVILVNRIGTPL